MRRPDPLPSSLRDRTFTRAEALEAGVSPERLRRRDIERIGRGRYRWLAHRPSAGKSRPSGPASSDERVLAHAATVLDAIPDACASHATAARLRRWWLPDSLRRSSTVHVIRPVERARLSRRHVATHRTELREEDVVRVHGRKVTSVERTWLDCASLVSVADLVVLGDSLVRLPHHWAEQRREPWTTIPALRECVDRYPGVSGVSAARMALALLRVGSDSPQESRLRLSMGDAGLPEPALQVECWDPEYSAHYPATADLGYPEWKIAIQYEGQHHGRQGQLERDLRRDQAFVRQGWTVLRFGSADSIEEFRTAIRLIAQALQEARQRTRGV